MQNRQLRQTQSALEEARDRYIDLYEFAPVGYLTLTDDGMISEINLTATRLLGGERSHLRQRRFSSFVADTDLDRWVRLFLRMKTRGGNVSEELALKQGSGQCLVCPDRRHVHSGNLFWIAYYPDGYQCAQDHGERA